MSQLSSLKQQTPQVPHVEKIDEQIFVVKRTQLFQKDTAWHGLKAGDMQTYLERAQNHQEYIARSHAELDPTYKQIIPYLIFTHNNKYFLMERSAQASEQRLKSKLTLGIGGHVRQEDITSSHLFDWARREFHEEVSYAGNLTITPLGIINDDSNPVGEVHIGFALLLTGDSDNIAVKSELKSGTLMTLEEISLVQDRLESWSAFVLAHLQQK